MLRVDFYLLAAPTADARLSAACRLTQKALQAGHRIYIQAEDDRDAEACDEWLWSFRPESFVPHHRLGDGPYRPAPVLIGLNTPAESDGICLNLSRRQPQSLAQFQRLLEVVAATEPDRQAARLRWRHYQQQGYRLEKHDL